MPWILYTPAPRRKDETMNSHAVFYYDPGKDTVDFGPWGPNGHIDVMDDTALVGCRMSARALAELLLRRPDPAKAQAELAVAGDEITRQPRNAVAWERAAIKARSDLVVAQAEADGLRVQLDRADKSAAAWERTAALRKADIDCQHADLDRIGRVVSGISAALDKLGAPAADTLAGRVEAYLTNRAASCETVIRGLRAEVATLRDQLRDPVVLRAAIARIDAKAAEVATLKARLATLENE